MYEIKTTEVSSNKYGNCEICGKYASEIFFIRNIHIFGHKECLERVTDIKQSYGKIKYKLMSLSAGQE